MKTNGFPFGLVSITLDYLSFLVDNYFGSLHFQQLFHMLVVCADFTGREHVLLAKRLNDLKQSA